MLPTEEVLGGGDGEDFGISKDNVSANLKSMTNLLNEMQQSQSIQSSDVQLTFKVADMADRLYGAEQMKNRINKGGGTASSSSPQIGVTSDRNF